MITTTNIQKGKNETLFTKVFIRIMLTAKVTYHYVDNKEIIITPEISVIDISGVIKT